MSIAFERMPILADALMDARFATTMILSIIAEARGRTFVDAGVVDLASRKVLRAKPNERTRMVFNAPSRRKCLIFIRDRVSDRKLRLFAVACCRLRST